MYVWIYIPNSSQFTYVQFLPIYMYAKFMLFHPYRVLAKIACIMPK